MAKLIVEKINTNTVDILGKTFDSCTYSGDVGSREKIKGQTYLTLDDVDGDLTVRNDRSGNLIRKVEKLEKAEVSVQLLNAEDIDEGKSLATVILRDVYTAEAKENKGLKEIFVMAGTNCDRLSELINLAAKMARTPVGERANGKWYPSVDGKRVIIRIFNNVNSEGKISGGDCDCNE